MECLAGITRPSDVDYLQSELERCRQLILDSVYGDNNIGEYKRRRKKEGDVDSPIEQQRRAHEPTTGVLRIPIDAIAAEAFLFTTVTVQNPNAVPRCIKAAEEAR